MQPLKALKNVESKVKGNPLLNQAQKAVQGLTQKIPSNASTASNTTTSSNGGQNAPNINGSNSAQTAPNINGASNIQSDTSNGANPTINNNINSTETSKILDHE
ncbi:MAG: hypothetical protein MHPSP_004060 [Paramarteilia canceri]